MRAIEVITLSIKSHQIWIDYFNRNPHLEYTPGCKSVGDRAFHKKRIADYKEAIEAIAQLQAELDAVKGKLAPIREWYGGGTEGDRPDIEILTDAIADLQEDRKKLLQLQAEFDQHQKAFEILSPYHGKTNPKGRLQAIESSIKFIENKLTTHDAVAASDCVRCNAVSLARWVSEIIQALKDKK